MRAARLLAAYGIPTAKGVLARDWDEVKKAAAKIGYPVVLKVCSPEVSHKTESGLVAVDLRDEADLEPAFQADQRTSPVKDADFLVQEMIKGGGSWSWGWSAIPSSVPVSCSVWEGYLPRSWAMSHFDRRRCLKRTPGRC